MRLRKTSYDIMLSTEMFTTLQYVHFKVYIFPYIYILYFIIRNHDLNIS